jgi:hypothetical protein
MAAFPLNSCRYCPSNRSFRVRTTTAAPLQGGMRGTLIRALGAFSAALPPRDPGLFVRAWSFRKTGSLFRPMLQWFTQRSALLPMLDALPELA